MVRQIVDQIIQFFADAVASGKVRHEGQVTCVELAGTEPIDRITGFVGKACQAAIDRSVEAVLGNDQRVPAANNLMVSLYLNHDRGVRYRQVTDTMDLSRNLSRAMTEYAHKQHYLLIGNRVDVPPVSVRDVDQSGRERVEVFWKRSEIPVQPGEPVSQPARVTPRPTNEPSEAGVKGSDKITAESSEDEARLSEPFALWVKDGQADPVLWDGLLTPFYFGRDTRHPQVDFEFAPEDQISRDHFAILYLPRERFLIRNNGRNGTMIIRDNRAVRLYTPPSMRDRAGSARIARLCEGDIIRLQAGPLHATRIVQMAFANPDAGVEDIRWVDSLQRVDCADVVDPVVRRMRDSGPPDQYTLICGDQYLGSAVTQGIKFSYAQQDQGFVGGSALAIVRNFGGVTVKWLRSDVPATVGATAIPTGVDVPLRPGDELSFGLMGDAVAPTRIVFEWSESNR
jgi:hypothetical protein